MQNVERLLTNFNLIIDLKNTGFSNVQIARDLSSKFACEMTPRQLRYFIDKVTAKRIHPEYNDIIMLDTTRDAWDKNLSKYCVDFHGLLITYKSLANLTDSNYIITPANLVKLISHQEPILYAKRILKLYDIPDRILLEEHKLLWAKVTEIDLPKHLNKIHQDFNTEFNNILIQLRELYIDFLTNHEELHHANTTKNVQFRYTESTKS